MPFFDTSKPPLVHPGAGERTQGEHGQIKGRWVDVRTYMLLSLNIRTEHVGYKYMRKLKGESWHIGYPADGPSEWSGFGCTCSIPKHFAAPSFQPPSSLSPDTVHAVWASPHTKRVFNLWLSRGPQGRSPVATLHPSTQCRRMSLRAYVCLDLSTCICDRAAHVTMLAVPVST